MVLLPTLQVAHHLLSSGAHCSAVMKTDIRRAGDSEPSARGEGDEEEGGRLTIKSYHIVGAMSRRIFDSYGFLESLVLRPVVSAPG